MPSSDSPGFYSPNQPQFVALVTDLMAVFLGCGLAYVFRFGFQPIGARFMLAALAMALLVLLINFGSSNYIQWRSVPLWRLQLNLLRNWVFVALTMATVIYFAKVSVHFSRLWLGYSLLFSFILAAGVRIVVSVVASRIRATGKSRRGIFMIGPPETLLGVAQRMRRNSGEGYSIAGIQRINGDLDDEQLRCFARRVAESGAQEVWICMPMQMGSVVKGLMYALRNETAEVRFFPKFSDSLLLNHQVSQVLGMYSIDLSVTPINGPARTLKRLEDLVIGSAISLMILPVCLGIAVALKLTSPGPVLFKQYRTGINGQRFKVYKFRSMEVHEESSGRVTQAKKGDSRVTPLGAFLRRTSLDELPQFYNVLQGRMSIVGPRPHALAHNDYYKDLVESYMRRHKVKPGITGWAQVNGLRGETDTLDKMRKRVEHDLWYIDNWSVWLDLRIIFLTVFKGFANKNAY